MSFGSFSAAFGALGVVRHVFVIFERLMLDLFQMEELIQRRFGCSTDPHDSRSLAGGR
jgi:hypothetical protein